MVAGHLRLLFVTDERAIALQDEVAGTPCFDVFTWREEGAGLMFRGGVGRPNPGNTLDTEAMLNQSALGRFSTDAIRVGRHKVLLWRHLQSVKRRFKIISQK